MYCWLIFVPITILAAILSLYFEVPFAALTAPEALLIARESATSLLILALLITFCTLVCRMRKAHGDEYQTVKCKLFMKLILQMLALILTQLNDLAGVVEVVRSVSSPDNKTLDFIQD